jgi:hypothetical protein
MRIYQNLQIGTLKKNILGTRVMLAFSSANIKRLAQLMKFCRQIEIRQNQHI